MSQDLLRELEGKIGILPWQGRTPDFDTASYVKQWLLLRGMPQGKIDNLDWRKICNCYETKNYFDVVVGNRPRKVDPRAARLMGAFQTVEPTTTTPEQHNLLDTDLPVETSKANLDGVDLDTLKTEILDAIRATNHNQIVQQLAANSTALSATIQNSLINKFNSGELKIEFSDKARDDIRALILKTSTDFLKANLSPQEIIVTTPDKNLSVNVGHVHREFPTLLKAISCKLHVMLVGTASSSKTTSAKLVAEALGLDFHHMGAAASEFKFAGYEDATGKYHPTPFRKACEHGGLILLDEYDASIPAATMFIQAALANGTCQFPDKTIELHPDFVCIAACNTYGRGSDRQFVGRNQQDAANMDRFVILDWDIDEDLEAQLFGDGCKNWDGIMPETQSEPEHKTMSPGDWVRYVQKIRAAVHEAGERHLVTMRTSDFGARLLRAGMSLEKVEAMCMWKGLNPASIEKIKHIARV